MMPSDEELREQLEIVKEIADLIEDDGLPARRAEDVDVYQVMEMRKKHGKIQNRDSIRADLNRVVAEGKLETEVVWDPEKKVRIRVWRKLTHT